MSTASTPIATQDNEQAPERASEELSMLAFANVLLRYRRPIVGLTLLLAVVVSAVTLLTPREYTASASFVPQARKQTSTLSGLASQFGLPIAGLETGQSPAFYVDLLQSRQILGAAVDSRYSYSTSAGTATTSLVEAYHSRGANPPLRRDDAIRHLQDDIAATAVARTGMVRLDVTAKSAMLAQAINLRLLALVNDFNLRSRQSQARAERAFTERRVAEMQQQLREAEDHEQAFLQRNRDYQNSPELTFQADRLQREASMISQVYTTLSQSFEQARIEEVRDTPVITIVEAPEAPVRPNSRHLVVKLLSALVLGMVLGVTGAVGWEFFSGTREREASEVAEFQLLRSQAADDFLHPWRPIAALWRRKGRGAS